MKKKSTPRSAFLNLRVLLGLFGGGNFCPGDPVTRQQMAVFLVKGIFPESFHIVDTAGEPAFQNGWTNFGGGRTTVGFYIDTTNVVHLKGSMTNGSNGNALPAFTLPPGYRPSASLFMPAAHGDANKIIVLRIDPNGDVTVFCQGGQCNAFVAIDAISFRVGLGGA